MVRREHAKQDQHLKPESRFFVVGIERRFELGAAWYRQGEARRLVLEYYVVLRSVLKAQAHLKRCLTRCADCRIFFFTDPRNQGRSDLRCPFGCRVAHRRKRSAERSAAYNRSPVGKLKKKLRNQKRGGRVRAPATGDEQPPSARAVSDCHGRAGEEARRVGAEGIKFNPPVVSYLRMVTSLIEGRRVKRDEILEMLRQAMRQHRLVRERRIDYVVRTLKDEPP